MATQWRGILEIVVCLVGIYMLVQWPTLGSGSKTSKDFLKRPIPVIDHAYLDWALHNLALPLSNASADACPSHSYQAHIYNHDPLMIYIENFVAPDELASLSSMVASKWEPATIWSADTETHDTTIRQSLKAPLDRSSSTVLCIEERARSLQGWREDVFIEKLWAQKYEAGGYYKHHFDWGSATGSAGRISSFMVWLDDECEGGGTNFPRITIPEFSASPWRKFLECETIQATSAINGSAGQQNAEPITGTTWKPVKGNAVYWENFNSVGEGYIESWHAGLPVTKGVKVGLNIWTWWQPGLYDALSGARKD